MGKKHLVVATHGHCFDGLASAALFSALVETLEPGSLAAVRYRSCGYGPGMSAVPEEWLDGRTNAILDFRYTASDKLTWYFDHHVTGFGSDDERDQALAKERVHYDPAYGSCAKLIADVARDRYGVSLGRSELVRWADTIDAARFASADAAIDGENPALQLAAVVEHHGDEAFLARTIPLLLERPLLEVAADTTIRAQWEPIARSRAAFVERVRRSATRMDRVVFVDLTDAPLEVAAKFVTYALFPDAVYSVTISRAKHFKISVGYNPWSGAERAHDIAALCRRYGGGGHPVVGAATFPIGERERALEAARTIARELAA
jgi:hypothetical protein